MSRENGLDQDLMVEVWRIASRIVLDRPWLLASWVDNTPNIPHVVVHDGAIGAALHFDHEDGPYWSGGFTRRLAWAELASRPEPEEWATAWGNLAPARKRKNRAAAYALISSLTGRWVISKSKWVARPAPMLGEGPDSAFDLIAEFPTASDSVQSYLSDIERDLAESEAAGQAAYWHEPLWLVRRDGEPRVLIDEAGLIHLPITVDHHGASIQPPAGMSLERILRHGEVVTGLAAGGYSFDLHLALDNLGGPERLAEFLERGIAAVIFALEPDGSEAESSDALPKGDRAPIERDHWGWDYGDGDYVVAWLRRATHPEALETWHNRERVRRRRIEALRDRDDPTPLLAARAVADDLSRAHNQPSEKLRLALERHLRLNLLPAAPAVMIDACLEAVRLAEAGLLNSLVTLPPGVTFADQYGSPLATRVAAQEVIRQHSLSDFVEDPVRRIDRVWDLDDALEAWRQADLGEWEIPSPIPSWPEYVTLLLVGRNHLVPGVDDDPGERDQLRQWWNDQKSEWDWNHVESWWSNQDRMAMNLPGPEQSPGEPLSRSVSEDDSLLDEKEKAEAGGFHLVASATFSHLLNLLDRATRGDDPTAVLDLYSAGGIAWKYAGHLSLDELPVGVQRQAARSWRETRRLLIRDYEAMPEEIDDALIEQSAPQQANNVARAPHATPNTHVDEFGRLVSAARISAIDGDEIFVFGANGRGQHGSGSARAAYDHFGAEWGVADGPTGQSYAIDTMSGEPAMAGAIERFLAHAAAHRDSVFLVTAIGTGIAGYSHSQVAQHFASVSANVALPQQFWDALPRG